jgi:hypothetical protein
MHIDLARALYLLERAKYLEGVKSETTKWGNTERDSLNGVIYVTTVQVEGKRQNLLFKKVKHELIYFERFYDASY